MKLGSTKDISADLRQAARDGFKFSAYVGQWRGRRYISEISGVRKNKPRGMSGFSYMTDTCTQVQMRRIETILKNLKIPIKYE
jgi:hypothetical protein